MAFSDILERLMNDRGMSQSDLARVVGVTSQAVNQWVGGVTVPRGSRLHAIAQALGVAAAALLPAETSMAEEGARGGAKAAKSRRMDEDRGAVASAGIDLMPLPAPSIPSAGERPRTMPVWGTAEGGADGTMSIQFGNSDLAVDWAVRPKVVENARDAFGLYVVGHSMEPRWMPGEMLVVNPLRPVRPGDPVLIILKPATDGQQERRALFKRLVRRTPTRVVVEQTNPPLAFELDVEEVEQVWRIYEWGELLPSF